jgi:3'-phosphoadenosine 5'-phosphosulfate sulfotransferase (PAPS reductase)/FAD synthetase
LKGAIGGGQKQEACMLKRKVVCSFSFKINWTVLKDLMAKVLEGPPLLLIDSD